MKIKPIDLFVSKKITSSYHKPFFCFSASNYLPEKLYLELSQSFPKDDYFINETSYLKKSFSSRVQPEIYKQFIENSECWRTFLETFSSSSVIHDIKKTCFIPMYNSRGLFPLKKWKQKSESNTEKSDTLLSKIRQRFTQNIEVQFEFSILLNGSYIPPHTDSRKKIISLLLYFPEKNWKSEYNGDILFYRCTNPELEDNWSNISKKDTDGLEEFYRTHYEHNVLCGFVKSQNSWHAVEKLDIPEGISRRALCINIIKKY